MRRARHVVGGYLHDRIVRWQTGTHEGQVAVLLALLALSLMILLVSVLAYENAPAVTFVIPMLLGSIALRFQPLAILIGFLAGCVIITVAVESQYSGLTVARASSVGVLAIVAAIVLFESGRRRSGLPGPLGEAMLVDLNDRLQQQGQVPTLPDGWFVESGTLNAGGVRFSGDFMVARLREPEQVLEMVLVDVCGKGVAAGTQSLQLAGALGGLIGALAPRELFEAANDYLIRQRWDEGFATAAHVLISLETGEYSIINAGHPPVLHWSPTAGRWETDEARGIALGILEEPKFRESSGRLAPGEALLFFTDGVVETRERTTMEGIEWLQGIATRAVRPGFDGAVWRILSKVKDRDDDRAVLLLGRRP